MYEEEGIDDNTPSTSSNEDADSTNGKRARRRSLSSSSKTSVWKRSTGPKATKSTSGFLSFRRHKDNALQQNNAQQSNGKSQGPPTPSPQPQQPPQPSPPQTPPTTPKRLPPTPPPKPPGLVHRNGVNGNDNAEDDDAPLPLTSSGERPTQPSMEPKNTTTSSTNNNTPTANPQPTTGAPSPKQTRVKRSDTANKKTKKSSSKKHIDKQLQPATPPTTTPPQQQQPQQQNTTTTTEQQGGKGGPSRSKDEGKAWRIQRRGIRLAEGVTRGKRSESKEKAASERAKKNRAQKNTDEKLGEALIDAAMLGQPEELMRLLDLGADTAFVDSNGYTGKNILLFKTSLPALFNILFLLIKAVHWAASNGHEACISILIERGANINAVDYLNWTPLHYAVFSGCVNPSSFFLLPAPTSYFSSWVD